MDQILNLVGYCFACVSVAVVVLVWVHATFQTKKEAEKLESLFDQRVQDLKSDIGDLHKHIGVVKSEIKDELKGVQVDIRAMRGEYGLISKDLSYIRGRLEPKS